MDLTIAPASAQADIEAVRALCRQFEAGLRRRYEQQIWLVETYIEPESWFEELRDIETIYGPPEGQILLARLGGAPAGCVMMRRLEDGICEMKRLFVSENARGVSLGRRLCEAMIAVARERGYRRMRLDVGYRQSEAKKLYASLGFRPISPYSQVPHQVAELLDFMELEL